MENFPDDVLCHLFTWMSLHEVLKLRSLSSSFRSRVQKCDAYWSFFLNPHPMKETQHDSSCFRYQCFPLRCTRDFLYVLLQNQFPQSPKPFFLLGMYRACSASEADMDFYRNLCDTLHPREPSFYPAYPCRSNGKPFDFLHTVDMIRSTYVKIWKSLGIVCRDPHHFKASLPLPLSYEKGIVTKRAYRKWQKKWKQWGFFI